jgi:hypothetical protein
MIARSRKTDKPIVIYRWSLASIGPIPDSGNRQIIDLYHHATSQSFLQNLFDECANNPMLA